MQGYYYPQPILLLCTAPYRTVSTLLHCGAHAVMLFKTFTIARHYAIIYFVYSVSVVEIETCSINTWDCYFFCSKDPNPNHVGYPELGV